MTGRTKTGRGFWGRLAVAFGCVPVFMPEISAVEAVPSIDRRASSVVILVERTSAGMHTQPVGNLSRGPQETLIQLAPPASRGSKQIGSKPYHFHAHVHAHDVDVIIQQATASGAAQAQPSVDGWPLRLSASAMSSGPRGEGGSRSVLSMLRALEGNVTNPADDVGAGARRSKHYGDPFEAIRAPRIAAGLPGNAQTAVESAGVGVRGNGRRQRRYSLGVTDGRSSHAVYEAYPSDAEQLTLLKRANSRGMMRSGGSFVAPARQRRHSLGPYNTPMRQHGMDENARADAAARPRTNVSAARSRKQLFQTHGAGVNWGGGPSPAHVPLNPGIPFTSAHSFPRQQSQLPPLPASLSLRSSVTSGTQPPAPQDDRISTGHTPCPASALRASHGTPVKSWNGYSPTKGYTDSATSRSRALSPWDPDGGVTGRQGSVVQQQLYQLRAGSITSGSGLPLMSAIMLGRKNAAAAAGLAAAAGGIHRAVDADGLHDFAATSPLAGRVGSVTRGPHGIGSVA